MTNTPLSGWAYARVEGPSFVAGLEFEGGCVVETAPYLKFMRGWSVKNVVAFCDQRRWKCELKRLVAPVSTRLAKP